MPLFIKRQKPADMGPSIAKQALQSLDQDMKINPKEQKPTSMAVPTAPKRSFFSKDRSHEELNDRLSKLQEIERLVLLKKKEVDQKETRLEEKEKLLKEKAAILQKKEDKLNEEETFLEDKQKTLGKAEAEIKKESEAVAKDLKKWFTQKEQLLKDLERLKEERTKLSAHIHQEKTAENATWTANFEKNKQ